MAEGKMNIFAIDPGPVKSAYVLFDGVIIIEKNILPNDWLLSRLSSSDYDFLVIEQVKCYGMTVSDSIFDTVFWSGRFCQVGSSHWERVPRMDVKIHLCHNSRANDSNIRTAILDRFGGKEIAMGKKKTPGPLYGIKKDLWAAFALALTWWDQNVERKLYQGAQGEQVKCGDQLK